MKKIKFIDMDGDLSEAKVGENNALPHIQRRIEHSMPVETVDAEKLKFAVASFNVDFQRSITPKEAKMLVAALKAHIIKEIDKADKYYVKRGENGEKGKKS